MHTIVFYVSALGKGGAERVLVTVAEYLARQHKVVILTDCREKEEYELSSSVERISMENNSPCLGGRIGRIFRREYRIRKYMKRLNTEIAIGFTGKASVRMMIALMGKKICKITTMRTVPTDEFRSERSLSLANSCFEKADAIIFQTKDQMTSFSDVVGKKGIIIKNPIRESFCKEQFSGKRSLEVVSVGRIDKNKNQRLLIDACALVKEQEPELKLTIFGDGEDRNALISYVKELGLSDSFLLPGLVSDVGDKIYHAGAFVLSSDCEGIPNALMEAMALGVPVISTDCIGGGPRELIQDGINGYLIPRNDKKVLANRILYLLRNVEAASAMGREAQKIQEDLAHDKICERWENAIIGIFQKSRKVV